MSFSFEERASDCPLVESIWRSGTEGSGVFTSVAVSRWEMVVTTVDGKTVVGVRGPETKASSASIPPDIACFGIVFKHGVFMPRWPTCDLVDDARLFQTVTSRSFELDGTAWEVPTFDNADTFLARLAKTGALVLDDVVRATARGEPSKLSSRSVRRHWLYTTGLTQALVHRIDRARRAAALLSRGTAILETAHELEYFDQAHLTRALNRFVGHTPAELLRSGQDLAMSLSPDAMEFGQR